MVSDVYHEIKLEASAIMMQFFVPPLAQYLVNDIHFSWKQHTALMVEEAPQAARTPAGSE